MRLTVDFDRIMTIIVWVLVFYICGIHVTFERFNGISYIKLFSIGHVSHMCFQRSGSDMIVSTLSTTTTTTTITATMSPTQ